MSYNYKFRVIVDSYNCLSTFQFATADEAIDKIIALSGIGKQAQCYTIKHNTDSMRADYEYRFFDLVQLENQVGMVLCISPNVEPEFHGFRPYIEQALAYVDEYWYKGGKEDE